MNNIKKFTQQDRYGNMMSYELFEPQSNVPPVSEIPRPEGVNFKPKGTDTVPAMLTPGENVINAEASRKYQPMIDKMNNEGRAMQQAQGGPIPTYESAGGKIPMYANVGMNIKDFLKDKEGVRNEAYRDSGGVLTIGAGSTDNVKEGDVISDEEVESRLNRDLDIAESDYNKYVTAELNPNQKTAVTSLIYNIGGPNFAKSAARKRLNEGDYEGFLTEMKEFRLADGQVVPGLEDRRLAEAELFNTDYQDPIIKTASDSQNKVIEYDAGVNREPDFLEKVGLMNTASAASNDSVPEVDTGGITDTIRRIPGQIYDGVKSIGNQYIDQMKKTDTVDDIVSARNDLENHNQDIAYLEQQILNASENEKPRLTKKLEELKKEGPALKNRLKQLGKEYDKIPKYDGYKEDDFQLFPGEGLETGSVDEAINKSIPSEIKEVPKDTTGTIPKVSNVYDEPIGPQEKTFMDKAEELGKESLTAIGDWFVDGFSNMFDGESLARMTLVYAGSRAMGYDHGSSMEYVMEKYGKEREDERKAVNKYVLSKDATTKFTTKSLQKFKKTRDMTDLIPKKSSGVIGGGTGSRLWLQGYGIIEKVKTGKDEYGVIIPGVNSNNPIPLDHELIRGKWSTYDDDLMDSNKLDAKYTKSLELMEKQANTNLPEDSKKVKVNIPMLAATSTQLAMNDMIKYGAKPRESQEIRSNIAKAQDLYMKAYRKHIIDPEENDKPNSIEAYYNQLMIRLRTRTPGKGDGISYNEVKNTSSENFKIVDDRIISSLGSGTKNEQAVAYRKEWQELQDIWRKATADQRKVWNDGAKEQKRWDGFSWWLNNFQQDPTGPAGKLVK